MTRQEYLDNAAKAAHDAGEVFDYKAALKGWDELRAKGETTRRAKVDDIFSFILENPQVSNEDLDTFLMGVSANSVANAGYYRKVRDLATKIMERYSVVEPKRKAG